MRRAFVCCLVAMLLFSANAMAASDSPILLFIGQDLGAVGGLPRYTQGYIDTFGMPYGVSAYTSLPSLAGLETRANWGSGDMRALAYVEDAAFEGTDLALGLYLVGQCQPIAEGLMQAAIQRLGAFIQDSGRTVYLRIGYEFDGAWNHYDPAQYIMAYQSIVDTLREMDVDNFETVWQSTGTGEADHLLQWYPGDAYVDWMGYSFFDGPSTMIGQGILTLARAHGKPVFIAEAAPRADVKNTDAEALWEAWYAPFLRHIDENRDVIGAVSYINCNWEAQPMWRGQGWGDSRLQQSEPLRRHWEEALQSGFWATQK